MAKIYVSNLPSHVTEKDVEGLFRKFGRVEWVHLVKAMDTGESRGIGYVKMDQGTSDAIQALDGRRFHDKVLVVRPALPLKSSLASDSSRTPRRARTSNEAWSPLRHPRTPPPAI